MVLLFDLTKSQPCSKTVESIVIKCSKLENSYFSAVGYQLTCIAESGDINSTSHGSSVSSVVHSNGSEVVNLAAIGALKVSTATVNFIPIGIKRKFTSLKILCVSQSSLLSVNKGHLKEFGSFLEYLDFSHNFLSFIDVDLFKNNLYLRFISMYGNPLRYINTVFFTNLKSLKHLQEISFGGPVSCINQRFSVSSSDNGRKMSTFKWDDERCSDETAKIDGKNLIDNSNLCVTEKVEQIYENIQNQNEQNTAVYHNEEEVSPSGDKTIVSADRLTEIEINIQKLVTDNKNLSESFKKRMNTVEEKLDSLIEALKHFAK